MADIDVETRDGIGIITLQAPARRNALTVSMARELVAACEQVDADRSVGAVILRSEGKFFCAGADRKVLAEAELDPTGDAAFSNLGLIYRSFARVAELGVPSIAAVRGGAVGAGVNLLLSASVRIVATDASIVSGFSALGMHPGGGHLALMNRAAGYEATVAISLLGQPLSGLRARELGIAWEAVPDDEVDTRAAELAREAAKDPDLSRMVMASLRHEAGPPQMPLGAAVEFERAAQMRTLRRRAESKD